MAALSKAALNARSIAMRDTATGETLLANGARWFNKTRQNGLVYLRAFQLWRVRRMVAAMSQLPDISTEKTEAFITRWQGQEGGQERANYALFLTELCDVLDLPHPDPAGA